MTVNLREEKGSSVSPSFKIHRRANVFVSIPSRKAKVFANPLGNYITLIKHPLRIIKLASSNFVAKKLIGSKNEGISTNHRPSYFPYTVTLLVFTTCFNI